MGLWAKNKITSPDEDDIEAYDTRHAPCQNCRKRELGCQNICTEYTVYQCALFLIRQTAALHKNHKTNERWYEYQ